MVFIKNKNGFTLIAAVFILVILAFMGVVLVTLFTTSSSTSINDLLSAQALYVAEGGVEFHQKTLAKNLDWYRSVTDPLSTDTRSLGLGSFTVTTTFPATKLSRRLTAGGTTAYVYTTQRFPASGYLQIEDSVDGTGEFVQYTGISGNTFTGLSRGRMIGTVATSAFAHPRGSTVYPVTTLSTGLTSSCTAPTTFTIAANSKFLDAGVLDIEGEEIRYTGSSTSGGTRTLTGVERCLGSVGPVAHNAGQPVTPLRVGGDLADYLARIQSTGTVESSVRMMGKTVKRDE
jgi:hypothetical protein